MKATTGLTAFMLAAALALSACTASRPAPVIERGDNRIDPRAETYVVKRYDTLYSIALEHGLDWQDLARWNGISDPSRLAAGQVLRVKPPQGAASAQAASQPVGDGTVQVMPITAAPAIEARPIGETAASAPAPAGGALKTEPKPAKLPYSEQNLAALRQRQQQPATAAAQPEAPKPSEPAAEQKPAQTAAPATPAPAPAAPAAVAHVAGINWSWPSNGPILVKFAEGGSKGLRIGGQLGDPVLASAAGKVTYVGDGVRGYGNLVIVKHSDEYLSVYAHNRKILVQSGQMVSKGQKIAEMGNAEGNKPLLHFEIRRYGKPVDPLEFLPPRSG